MSVIQYPGQQGPVALGPAAHRLNYTVNSSFPSRKPRPSSLRGRRTLKRDVKDTMQHAALINIVAAVNEDIHSRSLPNRVPLWNTTPIRNNVTVISNFIFPHEKTVSIPQSKHCVFQVPGEIVQRKPVYYKHSGDLEVRTQSHLRLFEESEGYKLKIKKQEVVRRPKSTVKQIIKGLPTKPQIMDSNFTGCDAKKAADDKSSAGSRASSGVRRLGAIKKHEERKPCDLPKCEAVDLLDNKEEITDPAKEILDDSRKIIPINSTKVPYIRTKSLPVIFPVKRSNSTIRSESSQQRQPTVYKDRPLSNSLRKQTPDSMYKQAGKLPNGFAFEDISIHNGFNKAPDIVGHVVHASDKRSSVLFNQFQTSKNRHSMSLYSPSSPNLGRGHNDLSGIFITDVPSYNTARARHELNEAVRRVMSGKHSVDARGNIRTVISARSKKSCLTTRSGVSESLSGVKTPKKVKFLSSDSSLSTSETNSLFNGTVGHPVPKGGTGILEVQPSDSLLRSYSPGIQPMSARELLRLEKKILPANTPPPLERKPNYFLTGSLITVQQFKRNESELCSDTSASVNSELTDNEEGSDSQLPASKNKNDSEKLSSGDSEDGVIVDNDDDDDEIGFYKLVKALEKQPYDGFEHKKMRRSAGSNKSKERDKNDEKPKYVKVRLS